MLPIEQPSPGPTHVQSINNNLTLTVEVSHNPYVSASQKPVAQSQSNLTQN